MSSMKTHRVLMHISLKFILNGPIDNKSTLLNNDLAANGPQAITRTNINPVYWRIYSWPGRIYI